MTPHHTAILRALADTEVISTAKQIAWRTGISRPRLEPMLRVLYKRGLVGHTVRVRPRKWMLLWAGSEALKEKA